MELIYSLQHKVYHKLWISKYEINLDINKGKKVIQK